LSYVKSRGADARYAELIKEAAMPIAQLHPMVVHFPIVFILTMAVFDVIAAFRGSPLAGNGVAARISTGLAVLAGLFAAAAYVFGDMALSVAEQAGVPEARLEQHEGLGTTTAAVLVVWMVVRLYFWWRGRTSAPVVSRAFAGIEVVLAALIVATAYFGGQLVYDFGVNVHIPA
jgi:uncharacterized membrane protein